MRIHRFFIDTQLQTGQSEVVVGGDIAFQIKKVFRLGVGDRAVLFNGNNTDYISEITDMRGSDIVFKVVNESASLFVPSKNITLFASVIKKDHFELVVEKSTELGVNTIQPVLSARSEKKSLNHERLVRIATEASEQCGRGSVPKILPVAQLEQVLHAENKENISKKIVFHTQAPKINIQEIQEFQNIDIFIGPEGGWTDEEIQLFKSNGFDIVGLGHQILRAETASIASLSILTLL